MHPYQPQKIVVDSEVLQLPFTTRVLAKFPKIQPLIVSRQEYQKEIFNSTPTLSKGKKTLYLKRFLGSPVKLCPGFSMNAVCCNYYTLDFIENCPLECSYCILQAIHNQPNIVLHTNVEEILKKIALVVSKRLQMQFSIGTGEHSDSLALDSIFELNPVLVEFFSQFSNVRLELKTKTDAIEPLLALQHNGNTVVSWSLNTEYISRKEEHKTASAKNRILAAKKLVSVGYPVGFHFDPLIYYEDWQTGYNEIIDFLAENINQERIAWISVGTLRYVPKLKKIAEERFPKMDLFCSEFNKTADGKMKYIRPIREMLCGYVSDLLKKKFPKVPRYLCMEQSNIWENTMDYLPKNPQQMEQKIRSRVF